MENKWRNVGIAAVVIVVVVVLLIRPFGLFSSPGSDFEEGFRKLNSIWSGDGIDMSNFDYDEAAVEALSVAELNSLKSSLTSFKSENSASVSLSELADVHINLVDFSLKSKQFKAEVAKVSVLSEEEYCSNIALFEARNSVGAEKVALLQVLVQKIESFNETYPEEAEKSGLALAAYNLGELEEDQGLMELAAVGLNETCEVGIL